MVGASLVGQLVNVTLGKLFSFSMHWFSSLKNEEGLL